MYTINNGLPTNQPVDQHGSTDGFKDGIDQSGAKQIAKHKPFVPRYQEINTGINQINTGSARDQLPIALAGQKVLGITSLNQDRS